MGEETARLRAEIDQTRENLTRDVDLLAEKTSPSKIVERRVERTKRGISGLKDKVMGAMPGSDDDEYSYNTGYTSDYSYGSGESGGQGFVGNATSTVSGGVSSAAGTVSSAAGSAKESVTGAVSNATSTVGDAASSVGDAAHGAVGTVKDQAEGNPLAAGLVAFGVGWLVSSLMPASEAEQRAARRAVEQAKNAPVVDQVKTVAQDVASDVGHHMQESATEAAQQVKERAQDATSTVKDEAQGAAQDVKQSAQGAAQDVKDQTQQHAEAVRSGSGSNGSTY
jgi:uncharacterized protein YjbJ (UPF0337 family)